MRKLFLHLQLNRLCTLAFKKGNSFLIFLLICLFFSLVTHAQNKTITGLVRNEKGEPLAAVSVSVKDSKAGTTTGTDGRFSIQMPEGKNILVFSIVGYESKEISVTNQTSLDVQLQSSAAALGDVVVVAYGTQKKTTLSGAVADVKGTEIVKSPTVNVSNSLAGRLPGLTALGTSGEPGNDDATLLIRGLNTYVNGASGPLIVIDGVPFRDLNRIDPSIIDNITVLKDASAAIYGSLAANGVILVTTKKAKAGNLQVSASFNQGFNQPARIPEVANAVEHATLINEIDEYAGQPLKYTVYDLRKFADGSDPWLHPNTDWFNTVLKDWSSQYYANVTLSGGSEKARVFISLSDRLQDGYYHNSASKYKQHDLQINFDGNPSKYIDVSVGLTGRLEERNFPNEDAGKIFTDLTYASPTLPAVWPNGLPGPPTDQTLGTNPVVTSTSQAGYNTGRNYVFNLNGKINVRIPGVEGLVLTGTAAIDRGFNYIKTFVTPWYLYTPNGQTGDDGNPVLVKTQYGQSSLSQQDDQSSGYIVNFLANYEKKFLTDHYIKILGGIERLEQDASTFYARRINVIGGDELVFGSSDGEQLSGSSPGKNRWQNYFGRVNYSYKEKYLLEFVWRYQGTSKFDESVRFGFFPGISAAYRISEEKFWKQNLAFINSFKIRASWGKTGNDFLKPFQFLSVYSPGYYQFVTTEPGTGALVNNNVLYETVLPNLTATWEEADQKNIGFDATFLNNSLSVTADYFNYPRSKILAPLITVPTSTGFAGILPDINVGKTLNRGFDFSILYRNHFGKVSYQIGLNGGYAKNKVLFSDEVPGKPVYQQTTGHPIGAGLYYTATGIFTDSAALKNNPGTAIGIPTRLGDIIYEDINNDGVIDALDQKTLDKSYVPIWTGGLTIGLQYKDLDVSVLVQGASGGYTYITTLSGDQQNFLKNFYDNRWTEDNPNTSYPRTYNRNNEYWTSSDSRNTLWLAKTNYVRLKNTEIGYSFSKGFIQRWGLQKIRVYANGYNLLTYTPDKFMKDYDPETNPSGDGFAGTGYPIQRIVNIGINVQF